MGFSNPIVAGEDLIRTAIRSPNYVAGVSGWRIARDGSAEFNNVTIRGTLQSNNFVTGVSGWRLLNTGQAEFSEVTVRGSSFLAGATISGTLTMSGAGKIRTAPSGSRLELTFTDGGLGQNATIQFVTNTEVDGGRITGRASGPGIVVLSSGFVDVSSPGITLTNGLGTAILKSEDAAVGSFQPHAFGYARFGHKNLTGIGDYAVLQRSDGATYLNAASGQRVNLRINNSDAFFVDTNKALRGSVFGTLGTIPEVRATNALVSGAGGPNFLIQAGTVVSNFVAGNSTFSWAQAFPGWVYGVVVSEGGGSAGWIFGTQNYSTTGTGVYGQNHAGTFAGGLFRINFFALGS